MADILGKVADKFFTFLNSVIKIFNPNAEEIVRNTEIELDLKTWWETVTK